MEILLLGTCISYTNFTNALLDLDNFYKLQLIQNHAARIVKKAPKLSSASELLFNLHWLPIKQRVSYKIALTVYKCLHVENFPSYLKDLITPYTPSRNLRSGSQYLLEKPFKKLKTFGKKSFHYAAPEVWNSLPLELRSCSSLPLFKKKS